MEALNVFLYGALTALAFIAGVFFVRYWRISADRLFVFISITFFVLAGHWASIAALGPEEHAAYCYLPRLGAFLALLIGIADKNRRGATSTAE